MKIRQIVATMFSLLEDNLKENNIPYYKDETGSIDSIFPESSYNTENGALHHRLTPKCESGKIVYYLPDGTLSDWDPGFTITSEQFGPVGKKMMSFVKLDK